MLQLSDGTVRGIRRNEGRNQNISWLERTLEQTKVIFSSVTCNRRVLVYNEGERRLPLVIGAE